VVPVLVGYLLTLGADAGLLGANAVPRTLVFAAGVLLMTSGFVFLYPRLDEVERAVHDLACRWALAATLAAALVLAMAERQGALTHAIGAVWPVGVAVWLVALVAACLRHR
jgi:hypothetical protein